LLRCSAASSVLLPCPTPHPRARPLSELPLFGPAPAANRGVGEISRVPRKELLHVHGVYDRGRPALSLAFYRDRPFCLLLRLTASASPMIVSRLNTQPMASPVNASPFTSRQTVHDSGPRRFATPYLVRDFHPLFLAGLSRRTNRQVNSTQPALMGFPAILKNNPQKSMNH